MFLLASFCTGWVIGSLFLFVPQTCFQEQSTASVSLPWKAATRAHQPQWTPEQVSESLSLLHCQKTGDLTHARETQDNYILSFTTGRMTHQSLSISMFPPQELSPGTRKLSRNRVSTIGTRSKLSYRDIILPHKMSLLEDGYFRKVYLNFGLQRWNNCVRPHLATFYFSHNHSVWTVGTSAWSNTLLSDKRIACRKQLSLFHTSAD